MNIRERVSPRWRLILKTMLVTGCLFIVAGIVGRQVLSQAYQEAPTGFDNQTNGMVEQVTFSLDRELFEKRDTIEDGLGPVYNAQSCVECHQNTVSGGGSQILVVRAGHLEKGEFVDAPGGSLINDRAIDPALQEYVPSGETIRSQRISLSTLGDGFVEAIDDQTLLDIAARQPGQSKGAIAGQAILVPILESPGATRVGRFGWKAQHASLLSFTADAYLNEVGITSRLEPEENSSLGRSVAAFDKVADIEDADNDIDNIARFMRATKAPAPDSTLAQSAEARQGGQIFSQIGCAICHVPSIVTGAPGKSTNGGTYIVPAAFGNKVIHPYSDFLLHNVGTGDGIVQNGGRETANKMRTPPLWGFRTRNRFMHDGQSLTPEEAIRRHGGEAGAVTLRFNQLGNRQKSQLITYLRSL
ncbi:MAG: di-heme oxidoredictase family protein [Acidobacteriota bacterium]